MMSQDDELYGRFQRGEIKFYFEPPKGALLGYGGRSKDVWCVCVFLSGNLAWVCPTTAHCFDPEKQDFWFVDSDPSWVFDNYWAARAYEMKVRAGGINEYVEKELAKERTAKEAEYHQMCVGA